MLKSKGYFMFDIILSLSAWVLVSATILPMVIQIMIDTQTEKNNYRASVVLYEKLHELIINGQIPERHSFFINGNFYEFIPNEGGKEACIEYEVRNQTKRRICEFLE